MQIKNIILDTRLKPYVTKSWVYESLGKVADPDLKLIVPNGLIKIVIPFKNGLSGNINDFYRLSTENEITVIGMCNKPSVVDCQTDSQSGTIGFELSPLGAYRLFNLNYIHLQNKIFSLVEILGNKASVLQSVIDELKSAEDKIKALEQFLLQRLSSCNEDNIFDHCINYIEKTSGRITVTELARSTGYSARYLNTKFSERIGLSPKGYASVVKFNTCYKAMLDPKLRSSKIYYHYYYDQSHFINDFKRYSGMSPLKLERSVNDFGNLFFR